MAVTLYPQEEAAKIVEEFFLKRTDKDLYIFLQEVLERPLVEKVLGKANSNRFEAEKLVKSLHSGH